MVKILKRDDIPVDTEYEKGLAINFGIDKYSAGSKRIVMGYTVVPPGNRNQRHFHANCEASMFILKGRLRFFIGEEKNEYEVGPMTFVYAPQGEIHALQNLSDTETAELIFAYGCVPTKEDAGTTFLEKPWV